MRKPNNTSLHGNISSDLWDYWCIFVVRLSDNIAHYHNLSYYHDCEGHDQMQRKIWWEEITNSISHVTSLRSNSKNTMPSYFNQYFILVIC